MIYTPPNGKTPPTVTCGGNCSIQSFDGSGAEVLWTVAGGNVTCLAFSPERARGAPDLLVGGDDYAIRTFSGEESVAEVTESDVIDGLCGIRGNRVGYALRNGTIGVYEGDRRVWRVKSKHCPRALISFDLDADGVPELVSGWSDGAVNVRREGTGEVVFKDKLDAGVAGIVTADYRMDGNENVIVVGTDGTVRGYLPDSKEKGGLEVEAGRDVKAIEKLNDKKKAMMMEMQAIESGMVQLDKADRSSSSSPSLNTIPPGTDVTSLLQVNNTKKCVELVLSLTEEAFVHSTILIDTEGGVFDTDTMLVSFDKPGPNCRIPVRPLKNTTANLQVQVHAGARSTSTNLSVFEFPVTLPVFCNFLMNSGEDDNTPPKSSVTFSLASNFDGLVDWVEQSFILTDQLNVGAGGMQVKFTAYTKEGAVRERLWIQVKRDDKLKVKIGCDGMELAGEVIQNLCKFIGVTELESEANFPDEMVDFGVILGEVTEFHSTRTKLTADMADSTQRVKALVVRAEDARLLGEMRVMRGIYSELFNLNGELIGEYAKRSNNHQALLASLKKVNVMINRASNLRVGKYKTRVVTESRSAIKKNNFDVLFGIVQQGSSKKVYA